MMFTGFPVTDIPGNVFYRGGEIPVLRKLVLDFLTGVYDRGMVLASENLPTAGSEVSVSSRMRYMAICRGTTYPCSCTYRSAPQGLR